MSSGFTLNETVIVSIKDITKGVYTVLNSKTGLIYTTRKGFLPAKISDIEVTHPEQFSVVLGPEEDISKQVGSTAPVYSLPLGISYMDRSMMSAVVFKSAFIEHRNNIGVPSAKKSVIPGKDNIYGKTYYSIGIPETWFKQLESRVFDIHGLPMTMNSAAHGKTHNGYVWFNANVAKNHEPTCSLVWAGKQRDRQLTALLTNFKQNIIGNVCCTVSLKRVVKNDKVFRSFTFSLKQVQVVYVTDISSPGLSTNVEFVNDIKEEVPDKFWSMVEKLTIKEDPSVSRRMLLSGSGLSASIDTNSTVIGGTTAVHQ
ncbi:hypothetical protein BC830DRAFT_1198845 [Chytriomyces sp. MP71]|nr:hypothetical protein BC830DRAFT_1198845 [Chytriomyces sp. MP71]